MAIRTVRTFPLRSDGLSQDDYSTGVENSLTDLPLAIEDFNAAASAFQLAVTGTSTTSVTIGTGSKSFTTQTGLGFVVGMTLRIANSSTAYMTGDVTSYNTGTGALVVNVTSVVGSGTLASWTISLSAVGASTAGTVSFTPAGNISATNVQAAIQELDTEKLSSAAGAVTGTNLEDITTAETVGSSYLIPVVTFDVNGRATSKATAQKIVSGTAINTTSSTSHPYTSISSSAKKITVLISGVSTSSTSPVMIQLGTSSGYETSGYSGTVSSISATTATSTNTTSGILLEAGASSGGAFVRHGVITINKLDGNVWIVSGVISTSDNNRCSYVAVTKSLSAALDRLQLTTVNGTDTFDAGSINILLE